MYCELCNSKRSEEVPDVHLDLDSSFTREWLLGPSHMYFQVTGGVATSVVPLRKC